MIRDLESERKKEMVTMMVDRLHWSGGGLLPRSSWQWFVLRGALALFLGVLAILFPANALFAFTMVFAAYAFVDGLASLVSGIADREQGRKWWALIFRGLVGVAVGLLFVVMPLVSTISYAVASLALVSVWSITAGLFEIFAAVRLRKEIEGEWLLGLSGLLAVLLGFALPTILMLFPASTILSVAWMIGIYALMTGVVLIMQGFRLRSASPDRSPGNEGVSLSAA